MLYGYEKLPDETFEEYRLFCEFLSTKEEVPFLFLQRRNLLDEYSLSMTERNHWAARRDNMLLVRNRLLRQEVVQYLSDVLVDIVERRSYLSKRLQYAENLEGVLAAHDKPDEIKAEVESHGTTKYMNTLRQQYTRALTDYNKDVDQALRILQTLSAQPQVVIQNNQLNAPQIGRGSNNLSDIQAEWGPVDK